MNRRRFGNHGNIGLAWLVVLGVLLLGLSPAYGGGIISEPFNNDTYNQQNFSIKTLGTGPTTAVTNNRLEITVPGNSSSADGLFGGSIESLFTIKGDFDAQVDYTLLTWPSPAGFAVCLESSGLYSVFRQSYAPGGAGEVYEAYSNGLDQKIATADSSGKLRLKRTGKTVAAFYWHNNTWTLINSNTGTDMAGATGIFICAYSNQFQGKTVQVAIDNIRIAYGSYAPGFLQLLLDD